jgi:hypothetical protein
VAIVYHAEAEWTGGKYDPFEKVAKVLMQGQIDCDIVPIDCLLDDDQSTISAGKLCINKERHQIIIVPYAECLPDEFLEKLNDFTRQGIRIVFMRDLPARCVINRNDIIARLGSNPRVTALAYNKQLIQKSLAG